MPSPGPAASRFVPRTFAVAMLLLFMALPTAASADADSLSDFYGPREVSIGESMRASATGARSITLNPAGLSLSREFVFEGHYGFRPEDDATTVSVSACDSTVPVPGCFYYNYFTASPELGAMSIKRRAHQFGWSASRAVSERLIIGTNTKYFDYNSQMTGEEDVSGFAVDVGTVFRASQLINFAFVGYNVLAEDSPQYPLAVATGLSVRPTPNLGLSADAVWNLDRAEGEKTGRYGGGAELFLGSRGGGYPLRVGGVHDTFDDRTFVTGGVGYINPKLAIDIGARKEIGGEELIVLGSVRLFGRDMK